MVSKWLFGMNYLVDLQTSKAKHCTARCRGNPSGTFPVPVWGWKAFQAGSGRGVEQPCPKGRRSASIRLLFHLTVRRLQPARAGLRCSAAAAGLEAALGAAPAGWGEGDAGLRTARPRGDTSQRARTRRNPAGPL